MPEAEVAALAVDARLESLLEVARTEGWTHTELEPGPQTQAERVATVAAALSPLDDARAWLVLATLSGRLPLAEDVRSLRRRAELDGAQAAVLGVLDTLRAEAPLAPDLSDPWPTVRIVTGATLVDVNHTALADFATGIQRVTRESIRRWVADPVVQLIGWHGHLESLRPLTQAEARRALLGAEAPLSTPTTEVIVPWRCTYVLPELAADVPRAERLATLAQLSGTSFNLIGYDLVPMTTAETSLVTVLPGFARNLAATRHARTVAPISAAAGEEYLGWSRMLSGAGLHGPRIVPVLLPGEAPAYERDQVERARARLAVGALPMVLVVGSHEPRKNHAAVLHAAELLWREGLRFSLTFIGGNSWNSEEFLTTLARLVKQGRPVETIAAATDDLLWGAYRVARFTVFPSVNEGFGLPVAESLAVGTPVLTSDFGAMREIADQGGGALLVDPRNDQAVHDGIRALLTDDELLARLRAEALARPIRTWDDYAREVWDVLVGHVPEPSGPAGGQSRHAPGGCVASGQPPTPAL